ncbi:hypothetical protein BJI47_00575 [Rhodococcus sp. 1168]|nr:hypothetical protein BJI47_00575 [Rhodococcus sp. 1168]
MKVSCFELLLIADRAGTERGAQKLSSRGNGQMAPLPTKFEPCHQQMSPPTHVAAWAGAGEAKPNTPIARAMIARKIFFIGHPVFVGVSPRKHRCLPKLTENRPVWSFLVQDHLVLASI